MCPGLRDRWLHKKVLSLQNLVIFNIYDPTVSRIPCRHLKWLARLSIFIHADILVLHGQLVCSDGHCGHIPNIYIYILSFVYF